jgi:hypothetical protein
VSSHRRSAVAPVAAWQPIAVVAGPRVVVVELIVRIAKSPVIALVFFAAVEAALMRLGMGRVYLIMGLAMHGVVLLVLIPAIVMRQRGAGDGEHHGGG